MKTHELKILQDHFIAVKKGVKTAEIRLDDRDYMPGDTLILKEWKCRKKEFSGRQTVRVITHITRLCGVIGGEFDHRWVVLSMKKPGRVNPETAETERES